MDASSLPPELREEEDVRLSLLMPPNLRDFIRENFGLYHPPGDYRALRAENLRRTQKANSLAHEGQASG